MTPPSRVVLLTRSGCHLCVEAEATVRRTCEDLDVAWQAMDVDADEALRAAFTAHVPVTFVDQELLSYWFLDETALRAQLQQEPRRALSHAWTPAALSEME